MDCKNGKNNHTTAKAAAISSDNAIGYWKTTGTRDTSKQRVPQLHPLASSWVLPCARASFGAG